MTVCDNLCRGYNLVGFRVVTVVQGVVWRVIEVCEGGPYLFVKAGDVLASLRCVKVVNGVISASIFICSAWICPRCGYQCPVMDTYEFVDTR